MEVILIRDQRTTTHRVLDRAAQSYAPKSTLILPPKCQDDVVTSNCYTEATITRTKRNNHAQRRLPYDSHLTPAFYDDRGIRPIRTASVRVSIMLRCVIVILLAVSVHGNPITDYSFHEIELPEIIRKLMMERPPKWVEPCGPFEVSDDPESGQEVPIPKPDQILHSIVIEATNAYTHALMFRDHYIKETFKTDFKGIHDMLIKKHYDWLPSSIPKELGETLNQEYLQTLDLDEELVKTYEFMQLYAMGLEQMVWDQEILGIKFATDFKECEFKLRSVLCEIQNAIMERGIMSRPNVNRDRMPPEYRADDLRRDTTCRITRDWVIFRDYMNGLEYVKEVFAYLRSRYIQSNQI